ncbi:MAG: glycerophosphodiester phosphodiesterase [Massiliimalia sp.]|jgi:glycerophosphoryl diester phosphodiesterase
MNHIINYAHRGASSYAPENTFSAFYLGLQMGADGIETDIHATRDGVLVLFHDDTLDRVTNASGPVCNLTYQELCEVEIWGNGKTFDRIVTLEEFLKFFGFRQISLAIELKQEGVAEQTVSLIDRYGDRNRVTITSFSQQALEELREQDKTIRAGLLTHRDDEETFEFLRQHAIQEYCPKADLLTPEKTAYWKSLEFGVRAWGIKDETVMAHAVQCGVDGMTVNFPDKLTALLAQKG